MASTEADVNVDVNVDPSSASKIVEVEFEAETDLAWQPFTEKGPTAPADPPVLPPAERVRGGGSGGGGGGGGGMAPGGAAALGAARGLVFVERGTARNASGESAEHLLAHFAFACTAAGAAGAGGAGGARGAGGAGGGGTARGAECALTGTPTSGSLGAGSAGSAGSAGRGGGEVYVESALIRGAVLDSSWRQRRCTLRVDGEPEVEVEMEATAHGLLLKRMRAPLVRAWRVVLAM